MDLGLAGKKALITGGSKGVGLAIANALAEEGCDVAIGARNRTPLLAAGEKLAAHGRQVISIVTDFSFEEGCKEFVDEAAEELDGIDILVNNVGGLSPGKLETISDDQWQNLVDVNLLSFVHTSKHATPHLKQSQAGRILNISGMSGRMYIQGALSTTLTNAAINGLTKQLAGELAPAGVTVNNLCPGLVLTDTWMQRAEDMAKLRGCTPEEVIDSFASQAMLGRAAKPEEVGWAAAFLVSERAGVITGATLEIDGGLGKHF